MKTLILLQRLRGVLYLFFGFCLFPLVWGDGHLTDGQGGDQVFRHGQLNRDTRPVLGCSDTEVGCSSSRARLISGLAFARMSLDQGVLFSGATDESVFYNPSFGLRVEAVSEELPLGDFHFAVFTASYIPRGLVGTLSAPPAVRLQFTLAETQVLFLCTDVNTNRVEPPLEAPFRTRCRPTAVFGGGATLASLQWDPVTGRFIGRWAQVNAVLNFFGNGHGAEYLRRHLNFLIGGNIDTIIQGSIPNSESEIQNHLRVFAGLSGVVRSSNSRWGVQGDFMFRPSVWGTPGVFRDIQVQARVHAQHYFHINDSILGSIGLLTEMNYCQVPGNCIGVYASDREPISFFLGATIGVSSETHL